MDLNGDGKHDWQDDYLTQKMIDEDSSDRNPMPSGHITNHGTPLGVIIFIIVTCLRLNRKIYGVITDIITEPYPPKYEYETWFDSKR